MNSEHEPLIKGLVEESLAKAEGLITMGWVKGHWAIDATGKDVPPESESACKWCEEGAINAATYHLGVNPETGQEDDEARLSLRQRVRRACAALLQAGDERHATAMARAAKRHTTSHWVGGAVSGIPGINDDPSTEHGFIIGAFQRARKLANLAKWGGT